MTPLKTDSTSWCVYIHISPSQKYYVGITSQLPKNRWRNGRGYKGQPFYNVVNKYGWNNIRHIIIASNLSEKEAKKLEVYWIDRLGSNNKHNGYNITQGGDGTVGVSRCGQEASFYGRTHSTETRALISKFRKEYYQSHQSVRNKPIYQFDLDGNFVQEHINISTAANLVGAGTSVISRVCQGKLNYTHGYIWAYKDDVVDFEDFKNYCKNRMLAKAGRIGKGNSKPVVVHTTTGELVGKYLSASEAARVFNVHKDTVAFACRKGAVMCGKYRCHYDGGDADDK